MDKYTASNGLTVAVDEERVHIETPARPTSPIWLRSDEQDALREFFRAEEDARLGRWRWNDYVVYHHGEWLTLVHELDGTKDRISVEWARNQVTDDPSRANVQYAAIAWAQAHPEQSYTVAEWVAKAMYEDGQDGRAWEGVEPNEKPAWLALAEAAISKYEEIR